MNNELKKILDDQGIEPAPKKNGVDNIANGRKAFDSMFEDPMKQVDDLFETFGKIFGPKFHEDRKRNYDQAKKKDDESK